jgi:argininosuccinate lyase
VKMWSGRFRQPLDARFEQWQRSFPFDRRLLEHELAASRAHSHALRTAGVLSVEEHALISGALDRITAKAQEEPDFLEDREAEDVHHFVEKWLVAMIGDTGKKLHSGRSRNEQIATDLRLFVRDTCDAVLQQLREFLNAVLTRAEEQRTSVMPAYTHLQRAEPVLVSHWLLAYFEMFWRDAARLTDSRTRINECPLGSGAVAGAPMHLDRKLVAQELGFDRITANSMDATCDRDFVIEFVNALTLLGVHLSRWAEELILFATQEYGFIRLPEAYSTGSSAMPQKQNPDALELIRAKAGRLIGCQTALLTNLKGLPLAYNKDLQDTQEPLFEASATASACLEIATGFMQSLQFNRECMRQACEQGFMNALAAATYLTQKGVPFRAAHEVVAHAVQKCMEKNCELQDLTLEELRQFSPAFSDDIYLRLQLDAVLECHDVPGGTAPQRVCEALRNARERLEQLREGHAAHA